MEKAREIIANISRVIIGKEDVITTLLTGILCNGHLLIEDVPGVGKTTLVKALATTLGCSFKRIQFTPDLMPSDIIGLSLYDKDRGEFVFKPGPIMSQVVLADEINRTSPKTQASLLEAMAERQVTVDGVSHMLPSPFLVIATQNPVEYEGTYPLPEAQLDRFMMCIRIGYPGHEEEKTIVKLRPGGSLPTELPAVISPARLLHMQKQAGDVYLAPSLESYIVSLTRNTRSHREVLLGVSPRGGQYLFQAAKAAAYIQGSDHVLPDHIKKMTGPVFAHRLILKPEARLKGSTAENVLEDILQKTSVPVVIDD